MNTCGARIGEIDDASFDKKDLPLLLRLLLLLIPTISTPISSLNNFKSVAAKRTEYYSKKIEFITVFIMLFVQRGA